MNKRCVIYARQSSGDNDVSESVELQLEKCRELAEKEHLQIVGEYFDLNTSGKTYPTGSEDIAKLDVAFQRWFKDQTTPKMFRDGLGKAIEKFMEVDYILCWDFTRIARPYTGSFLESHIHQLLTVHNVKVWSVSNGIIDVGSFNDSLILALQNRINNEQIAIQRKKAKEAMRKLKDAGKYRSGLGKMWGFKYTGRKNEIEINEAEWELVKWVYEAYIAGVSYANILSYCSSKFKHLLKEGQPFNHHALRKIISDPIYCGYMYNSKGELIESEQVKGMNLIPVETWRRTKEKLEKRRNLNCKNFDKQWTPLSGLVKCGDCDGGMRINGRMNQGYYTCFRHHFFGGKKCLTNIRNSAEYKEGIGLIECVYPLLVISILKRLEISLKQDNVKKKISDLKFNLNNLIEKEKRLTNLYTDGTLDDDSFSSSIATLKKKKDILKLKIVSLETSSENTSEFDKEKELLTKAINFKLNNADYESLVRETIKKISVFKEKVIFDTVMGSVTIPRQKISRFNLLPNFWFKMCRGGVLNLTFYHGIKNVEREGEMIADFGRLKIFYMKNHIK